MFGCLNLIIIKQSVQYLLMFIVIGMLLGADGPGHIFFDNAELAKNISTIALIFIMFYGGFGLNWDNLGEIKMEKTELGFQA